ncbi:helix-turn-helix domain-containing protein [Streptomyces sp. NPDC002346]
MVDVAASGLPPKPDGSLGAGIRTRRKHLGLTLTELAERTSLSQPFLSQVERGSAQPSMRSLNRIAIALNTNGPALLAGPPRPGTVSVVSRHDAEPRVTNDVGSVRRGRAGSARSLTGGLDGLAITEFVGGMPEFSEPYAHAGEEVLYIVTGAVEMKLGEHETTLLETHDSIAYPGMIPHTWRMLDPATMVLLISRPDDSRAHAEQDSGA